MKRRALLGGFAAGFVGISGCLDQSQSNGSPNADATDETTTDGTTDTTTNDDTTNRTTTTADVTVEDLTVTPAYVGMNSPDSITTYGDRDEQFVIVTATADGASAPLSSEFALEAGEKSYTPDDDVGRMGYQLWDYDEKYSTEHDGWFAFTVPKPLHAEEVALTWPGASRTLSEPFTSRLSRPPTDFEVGLSAHESVTVGEEATVTLTVENTGDEDGTFVGASNRVGPLVAHAPIETISMAVSAGETKTWEYTHVPDGGSHMDDPSMEVYVSWRDGSVSRTVAVES